VRLAFITIPQRTRFKQGEGKAAPESGRRRPRQIDENEAIRRLSPELASGRGPVRLVSACENRRAAGRADRHLTID